MPAEDVRRLLRQQRLPRRDLVRMHLVVGGYLSSTVFSPRIGFQGYLCLELR